jgi:hypothetical protein
MSTEPAAIPFKSYAVAMPGLAEFAAETSESEALAMMERYGISTEGWEASGWVTYGSQLFYHGAVAGPELRALYRALLRTGRC